LKRKKSDTDPGDTPQVDKFRDLARELECDDDEAAFDARLKTLAGAQATAAKAGHWRVEFVKAGHGHHAVFHPDTADTWPSSSTFPTPQGVYQWLHDRGCQQDTQDPDSWRD
jgi:hypothetical protein